MKLLSKTIECFKAELYITTCCLCYSETDFNGVTTTKKKQRLKSQDIFFFMLLKPNLVYRVLIAANFQARYYNSDSLLFPHHLLPAGRLNVGKKGNIRHLLQSLHKFT